MKASELRIGNLILGARGYVKVSAILESGLIRIEGNSSFFGVEGSEPCLLPIPLTEEWLVKFGFELNDSSWEIDNGKYVDLQHWGDGDYRHVSNRGCCIAIIETVSQLQNLYFALTGEELTIK